MRREELNRAIRRGLSAIVMAVAIAAAAYGQQAPSTQFRTDDTKPAQPQQAQTNSAADPYFKDIYRHFYTTYKLGPADEVAIRIVGQPDYTLEKAQVSPMGRIYHPLIGDIDVAGLTIAQATERLTIEFSQFIREPRVSISLLAANSSLVGVLGDVAHPGIVVMSRPMTLLDAISASGGVTDFGSQSNITLVRRGIDGVMRTSKVNLKRVLEGKGTAEDNVTLQAGDTLIVHGNTRKKIGLAMSTFGFGRFLDFLVRR
jgi:protein involved in polysaccharide export with SLBB domain